MLDEYQEEQLKRLRNTGLVGIPQVNSQKMERVLLGLVRLDSWRISLVLHVIYCLMVKTEVCLFTYYIFSSAFFFYLFPLIAVILFMVLGRHVMCMFICKTVFSVYSYYSYNNFIAVVHEFLVTSAVIPTSVVFFISLLIIHICIYGKFNAIRLEHQQHHG